MSGPQLEGGRKALFEPGAVENDRQTAGDHPGNHPIAGIDQGSGELPSLRTAEQDQFATAKPLRPATGGRVGNHPGMAELQHAHGLRADRQAFYIHSLSRRLKMGIVDDRGRRGNPLGREKRLC